MKNWSSVRSVSGQTYDQFKAYISSGHKFEYYFSDGLQGEMRSSFQNVFKDVAKANELWNTKPEFFDKMGFIDADELIGLANSGQLINHPIMDFVK